MILARMLSFTKMFFLVYPPRHAQPPYFPVLSMSFRGWQLVTQDILVSYIFSYPWASLLIFSTLSLFVCFHDHVSLMNRLSFFPTHPDDFSYNLSITRIS